MKIKPKSKVDSHLVATKWRYNIFLTWWPPSKENIKDVFANTNLVATKWRHHKLLTWWPLSDDKS
jgi:hypothetical protein